MLGEKERKGRLIILTGASGSGKDSVMNKIIKRTAWKKVITCCAGREMRKGEVDGVDYHFLTTDEFEKGIEEDNFLEYYRYGETLKGTRKGELSKAADEVIIWRIDPETAARAKELLKKKGLEDIANESICIYIGVPKVRTLFERQKNRDEKTSKEVIFERMKLDWKVWQENKQKYDVVVINEENKLDESVEMILRRIEK